MKVLSFFSPIAATLSRQPFLSTFISAPGFRRVFAPCPPFRAILLQLRAFRPDESPPPSPCLLPYPFPPASFRSRGSNISFRGLARLGSMPHGARFQAIFPTRNGTTWRQAPVARPFKKFPLRAASASHALDQRAINEGGWRRPRGG